MNVEQTIRRIKQLFPNASKQFIAANLAGFSTGDEKRVERNPLVSPDEREAACWYGAAKRFEVTYRIFSQRPCDYDGYDIKALQDLLVAAAIIPDDKWSVLSGRVISSKAHTKEEERTEIEIITL